MLYKPAASAPQAPYENRIFLRPTVGPATCKGPMWV
jgi:hypothetical protein